MARSDLLISLVKAYSRGDKVFFRQTLEAMIAEERKKQHHVLADRLAEFLKFNGSILNKEVASGEEKNENLFFEVLPQKKLSDLVLPLEIVKACSELTEEYNRADVLRSHNMEPRHKVLLAGPPGNGKTSLAEAIAYSLMVPLIVVRYDGVIGSFLGETSTRLRKVFDYVKTRQCVLFFDEFDTLGKERGDAHETGEIKRVVSSLLMQIDALPSHVMVITATNHPELLDRAVWRRFQLRLLLPAPTQPQLKSWFDGFERVLGQTLGMSTETLAEKFEGISFAELEDFCSNIRRRKILSMQEDDIRKIFRDELFQWQARFSPSDIKHNSPYFK